MATLQNLIEAEKSALAVTQTELERANELILNANLTQDEISKNFNQILSSLKAVTNNMVEIQNGISAQYLDFSKMTNEKNDKLVITTRALIDAMQNFSLQIKALNDSTISEQISARESFRSNLKELSNEIKSLFDTASMKQNSTADVIDELKKTLASLDEKASEDEE